MARVDVVKNKNIDTRNTGNDKHEYSDATQIIHRIECSREDSPWPGRNLLKDLMALVLFFDCMRDVNILSHVIFGFDRIKDFMKMAETRTIMIIPADVEMINLQSTL